MPTEQKTLSADEANARLPLVRVIVRDALATHAELSDRRERFTDLRSHRRRAGGRGPRAERYRDEIEDLESEIESLTQVFGRFEEELSEIDAVLVDPVEGVVEFRGRFEGSIPDRIVDDAVVWLVWVDGDERIAFWRPLESDRDTRYALEPEGVEPAGPLTGE
ncbi:MAG: DUF2203 family protein [Planctomycetota bacterium]